MRELYVFCEGPTEQGFCRQVLEHHLFPSGLGCIHPVKVATSKHSRGGVVSYVPLKRDIQNILKSRRQANVFFTSLIDLYGLPQDFPGRRENPRDPNNPRPYALAIESAFGSDIGDLRFLPHLQLHEYETMLFSDPDAFRVSFKDCDSAVQSLKAIVASVTSLEQINDDPQSAPSKRIIKLIPRYEGAKANAGPDIAAYIGIPAIRAKCPHFDQWLKQLESLNWGD
ncbi:MAG TPA: DUF4276 family protein [Tepidisphaeraceae bacterium]|nr:DUF4276 family protein [Tepidisphaeraceae bacterium]